jgi:hypothetical protein
MENEEMVSAIQGAGGASWDPQNRAPQLTNQQEEQVSEILSRYDPAKLASGDYASIIEELRTAGLPPTREVRSMIEEAGFDVEAMEPPSPPPQERSSTQPRDTGAANSIDGLRELLERYETGSLSAEEETELISGLLSFGLLQSGLRLDFDA